MMAVASCNRSELELPVKTEIHGFTRLSELSRTVTTFWTIFEGL